MTLWLLTLRDGWPVHAHRVVWDERQRVPKRVFPVHPDHAGIVFAEEIVSRVRTACGIETDPRLAYGLWEYEDDTNLPLQPHAICKKCLPEAAGV